MAQGIGSSTGALGTLARGLRPKRTLWQSLANFARRKPLGAFGAVVATLLIIVAIFAPLIATHDPTETNSAYVFAPPGSELLLGGDRLGRDVFSRLVYGARISLEVGILSVLFGATIGAFVGIVSAYFGGKTDLIVQRFVDALMAFPALILALAVMAVLGASITNVIIALSVVFIPATARIIRSQALSIKETDYVLAATAVGVGDWRIILRHMAPNCAATYIVLATLSLGIAIIVEASLSFLGVGVPPSVPSWGGMLTGAAQQYVEVAPWLGVFPGLAIAIVVFAWNLLGDSLRDVLDPRLRTG
jgi:ABC-type dipeptide/oligopeptide/nickel transport system permease subunit